jgi:hypothetical protein
MPLVRAKEKGFYIGRRAAGAEFDYPDGLPLPEWMELVTPLAEPMEPPKPIVKPKGKAPKGKAQADDSGLAD